MNKDVYNQFCTGCGLCSSVLKTRINKAEDGHYYALIDSDREESFCNKVCPVSGYYNKFSQGKIWGNIVEAKYGYSNNAMIREKASSGGILTSISLYLFEQNLVDGIIHVKADNDIPYETITTISESREDIIKHMGSRYSISSPLQNILELLAPEKKYAFIGKPCDISALRCYMEIDNKISKQIIYLLSFFCAGMPSKQAQIQLLSKLNCSDVKECQKLTYRGNGWPGYTTCAFEGNIPDTKMSYEEAWGNILGRDVKRICRFCMDGIGVCADIACGDAWYLDEKNEPIFKERKGRNIILVRSKTGKKLIDNAIDKNYICCESAEIKNLRYMQSYQFERRATMMDRVMALHVMRKTAPLYLRKDMLHLMKNMRIRRHLNIFKGTIKRIKDGRI